MNTITALFRKTILVTLVIALGLAAFSVTGVQAAGQYDPPTPPTPGPITNERLEQIWARQLHAYERIGNGFERADAFTAKIQELIDRAKANGKDVTTVQAALDAFEAALKDAHPIYESGKGIVNSHKGFDDAGKVTDPEQARQTVKDMHDKLEEIRDAMNGTGRALKEAIKAFREANPRPPRPTFQPPASGGQ